MAAEEHVLELFDTFWFEKTVLTKKTPSPLHSTVMDSTSQTHVAEQFPSDSELLRAPTLQIRSFSDQNLTSSVSTAFSDSLSSPNSVLTPQKLRPILSGQEIQDFTLEKSSENRIEEAEELATKKKQGHRRRFKKGKTTRSLSELEFKELKGFMDLGFVFSEEDKDSKLVSLIPGLQRLGTEDSSGVETEQQQQHQKKNDETLICRPYLSEAWGVLDQRKVVNPLLNWRVPALENEIDMKDNLRFWAHTVASIVR